MARDNGCDPGQPSHAGGSIEKDCEGAESFLIDDVPHTLKYVIENYCKSIEHKSPAPGWIEVHK